MANDIHIKGLKPITENLSTITVGGERTCLEISDSNGARVTGNLEVTGNIIGDFVNTDLVLDDISCDDITCDKITIDNWVIDSDGIDSADDIILDIGADNDLFLKENGGLYATINGSDGGTITLYESAGGTDVFTLLTTTNAATYISTTDSAGTDAFLSADIDGYIKLQSYGYQAALAESVGKDITLNPGGAVIIDKDLSETTAAFTKGLHIDLDRIGDVSSGIDNVRGIDIDVDHTGASGGTITSTGVDIDVTGDSGGTSIGYGVLMDLDGADTCYGLYLDVAAGTASTSNGIYLDNTNGGTDFKNISSADVTDYFTINTIANGVTTLTTVDSDGALANLNMVADGDFTVDAAGDISLDAAGGDVNVLQADVTIPIDKKVIFGNTGEYILGDNTNLDIVSSNNLNLGGENLIKLYDGATNYGSLSKTTGDTLSISSVAGNIKLVPYTDHYILLGGGTGFAQVTATFDATDTDIDFRDGNKQILTLTADIVDVHFQFPAVSGNFLCIFLQDGTGGWDVSNWKTKDEAGNAGNGNSGEVLWAGGSATTLTETADKADIISIYWDATNEVAYAVASENF